MDQLWQSIGIQFEYFFESHSTEIDAIAWFENSPGKGKTFLICISSLMKRVRMAAIYVFFLFRR